MSARPSMPLCIRVVPCSASFSDEPRALNRAATRPPQFRLPTRPCTDVGSLDTEPYPQQGLGLAPAISNGSLRSQNIPAPAAMPDRTGLQ
jgi:hypothetical protein